MSKRHKAMRNMDKKRAKKIGSLPDKVVLTKPVLACLFPMTMIDCRRLAGNRTFTSIEFARNFLRGRTADKEIIVSIFTEGASFKRLAENKYDKPILHATQQAQ